MPQSEQAPFLPAPWGQRMRAATPLGHFASSLSPSRQTVCLSLSGEWALPSFFNSSYQEALSIEYLFLQCLPLFSLPLPAPYNPHTPLRQPEENMVPSAAAPAAATGRDVGVCQFGAQRLGLLDDATCWMVYLSMTINVQQRVLLSSVCFFHFQSFRTAGQTLVFALP